ncbi:MAG TPA: hypothetical protein PK323_07755 [Bacteroidia bacterium]|nr:hypothetical protein [Bacteroidia bacterium]
MKKILFTFLFSTITIIVYAQSDSLDIFRTPSKNKSNPGGASGSAGNNSLSISLGHLGRGGTMLTYERYINNTPLAVFAGLGFSKVDFIGQFSWSDEANIFDNQYGTRSASNLGKMIDLGVKLVFDEELGGPYLGLFYSSYENFMTQKIDSYYEVVNFGPSTYKLNYNSRELKFAYGYINDVTSRFYNDFYIGTGFRFLSYDALNITELSNSYNQINQIDPYAQLIQVQKVSFSEPKLWFFIGWKIGVRF